jgi:hypothetical protein
MMQRDQEFAGVKDLAPEIDDAGVGYWSAEDFVGFLKSGVTADFEYVGGEMADVIEHTSLLSEEDLQAYADFFTRGGGKTSAE